MDSHVDHTRLGSAKSPVDNIREESRKVLETFLRIRLQDGCGDRGDGGGSNTNHRAIRKDEIDNGVRNRGSGKISILQVTNLHQEETKVHIGPHSSVLAIDRSHIDPLSSQSTCSSGEGARCKHEVDIDASQQTTSAAAAGSLSPSSSSMDGNRKNSLGDTRRKKSIFRRVKERLQRTMSLRSRRAEERAERQWRKQKANSLLRKAKRRRTSNESNIRYPLKELATVQEANVRLKFADMAVSTSHRHDTVKRGIKPSRTLGTAEKARGAVHPFLTPPDSGLRASAKKRPRRDISSDGTQKKKTSLFTNALESGIRLLKTQISSSSCSSFKTETKEYCGAASKVETVDQEGAVTAGLVLVADMRNDPSLSHTGILHRVSEEFDGRVRQLSGHDQGNATVDIKVQPATSSSTDPHSSISPPWSMNGQLDDSFLRAGVSESSQEHRSSYDSGMEEKYTLIAQRLADLGDSFLMKQWDQLRTQVPTGPMEGEPQGPVVDRLSSVEREMVEFINECDRDIQNGRTGLHQDVIRQLAGSVDIHQFERILNGATSRTMSESVNWSTLAMVFHLTSGAVRVVGASTNAAGRLIDYCCDYVTLRFSSWIIGQGGWSSVVEDGSSEDDKRAN